MLSLLVLLLLLAGLTYAIFKSPYVQTRLTQSIAASLSEDIGAEVSVGGVDIKFFKTLVLSDFLVKDQQQDTLAALRELYVGIGHFSLREKFVSIDEIGLSEAQFHLKRIDEAGGTNMDFLARYFSSESQDTTTAVFKVDLSAINISNSSFSYSNPFGSHSDTIFDPNNIYITGLNLSIDDISFGEDTTYGEVRHLSLKEKSGFEVNELTSNIKFTSTYLAASNLLLKTPNSSLQTQLSFTYDSFADFRNFPSAVSMRAEFENSILNTVDIGYFYTGLYNVFSEYRLSGKFRGPVNDLKGRSIDLQTADHSVLQGDFDLTGLPDVTNTFINFNVERLSTDFEDVVDIIQDFNRDITTVKFPLDIQKFGTVEFDGSFTGFLNEFVAYGNITTDIGTASSDLKLRTDSVQGRVFYDGSVEVTDFNIGYLFNVDSLGSITAQLDLDGKILSSQISADLKGEVYALEYMNYRYSNIVIDGRLDREKFGGKLSCNDPNLTFDFLGLVDFTKKLPVFDFSAQVYNINLTKLNILDTKEEFTLSTRLFLNATGNQITNLNGIIRSYDTDVCYGDSIYFLDRLELSSARNDISNKLSFSSDFLDLSVTGQFYPMQLPSGFLNLLSQVLPALREASPGPEVKEEFDFSINFKDVDALTDIFIPELSVGNNTTAYGSFNSQKRQLGLFLRSDGIKYKNIELNSFTVDAEKNSDIFKAKAYASRLEFTDSAYVENFEMDIEAYNDIVETKWGWKNTNNESSASAQVNFYLDSYSKMDVFVLPGELSFMDETWQINDSAFIKIDSSDVWVENFKLRNDNQLIQIIGSLSRDAEKSLSLKIVNFDLDFINKFKLDAAPQVEGLLTTEADIFDFYGDRIINSATLLKRLGLNNRKLGDVSLKTEYYSDSELLEIDGKLLNDTLNSISFYGDYLLNTDSNNLDLTVYLDQFDLSVLNTFDVPEVSNISGTIDGDISVSGGISHPVFSGSVNFDDARFKINYLNTFYTFSDEVRIEDGWFGIDYKPIFDEQGHEGRVVASVFHENFTKWNFDISADVNDFLLLNTLPEMNSLYYGSAYATGSVQLSGYTDNLEINIDATTNRGTSLKLPLSGSEEVTLENFVTFVSRNDSLPDLRQTELEGIRMTLNIEATKDAEVQLIFDEQTGDILRARGNGSLTFDISQTGEFSMFGRYEVSEGDYLFTLQRLINKRFKILPGGSIGWYGSPYDADIDITAAYNLRAPLYPVMVENAELYRDREQVELLLHLDEKLMNPTIDFSINLPQATANERSQLQSALSTTQQLNQQVFALLMLNRFLPVSDAQSMAEGTLAGDFGSAATNDFISTQISSWLSQISEDFEVGLNYRPGDEITNREIAVALSTQLFNERLQLSGNFGVTSASESQNTQGQSGLVGDFMIEYMITPDGKFRLKVFNQTNSYEVLSTTNSLYTQGVGLVYQEDFNTFDEFVEELSGLFKKKAP